MTSMQMLYDRLPPHFSVYHSFFWDSVHTPFPNFIFQGLWKLISRRVKIYYCSLHAPLWQNPGHALGHKCMLNCYFEHYLLYYILSILWENAIFVTYNITYIKWSKYVLNKMCKSYSTLHTRHLSKALSKGGKG